MTHFLVWIQPALMVPESGSPYDTAQSAPDLDGVYKANGLDVIVANLMQSYPPAGTDALVAPTPPYASDLTLTVTGNLDGTYTFNCTLTDLLTGDPFEGSLVELDYSPLTETQAWSIMTGVGTNPLTTDSNGNVAWDNITLTPHTTFYFRATYAGSAGHYPTIGVPTGVEVIVP